MSLYTFSSSTHLPSLKIPTGLKIVLCSDNEMLAALGNTTVEDVQKRIANNNIAFAAYINNQPAAFGWMAMENAKIGELNHEFALPPGNRYLWNFRTLEEFRGLGIYPALLQYILQNGGKDASRFWIIHAPENSASLKGITKAGFDYVGSLSVDPNGTTTIESTDSAFEFRDLLEYMNIAVSADMVTSCWNCSSPFLKKRSLDCCCSLKEMKCIGHNSVVMAA